MCLIYANRDIFNKNMFRALLTHHHCLIKHNCTQNSLVKQPIISVNFSLSVPEPTWAWSALRAAMSWVKLDIYRDSCDYASDCSSGRLWLFQGTKKSDFYFVKPFPPSPQPTCSNPLHSSIQSNWSESMTGMAHVMYKLWQASVLQMSIECHRHEHMSIYGNLWHRGEHNQHSSQSVVVVLE